MNNFGNFFRLSIFGESHGHSIGVVVDGCPAGLSLKEEDFKKDLKRRKGKKRGNTSRRESDIPMIKSGVFNDKTTGSPIMIMFKNEDVRPLDYHSFSAIPRPGHADFVAFKKHGGFHDFRGGGHFSGRITVALVAAGVIAKKLIVPSEISADIVEIGGSKNFKSAIDSAIKENDSAGGIIECRVNKIPVGLGDPFFNSVESLISHLAFAIPGIKGIEFGSGFACARMRGSECNDIFVNKKGKTRTNHAGGINGGITNGNEVLFRVAVRPTPSVEKEQKSINLLTGKMEKMAIKGRHDACFAQRIPVIIEATAAIVFADLLVLAQAIPKIWREKK